MQINLFVYGQAFCRTGERSRPKPDKRSIGRDDGGGWGWLVSQCADAEAHPKRVGVLLPEEGKEKKQG